MVQPIDTRPAELDRFVRDWSDGMLECGALTDPERATVTDAIRRCYEEAGVAWAGRVVWAASPLAARLLAADLARRHTTVSSWVRAVALLIRNAARPTLGGALQYGCAAALWCAALAGCLQFALSGDAVAPGDPDTTFSMAHGRGAMIGCVVGGLLMVAVLVRLIGDEVVSTAIGRVAQAMGKAVVLVVFGVLPLGAAVGMLAGLGLSWLVGGSSPPSEVWLTTLLTVTLVPAVMVAAAAGIVIRWRTDRPAPLRCVDPVHDRLNRRLTVALTAAGAADPTVLGEHTQVRNAVEESTVSVDRSIDMAVQSATRTGGLHIHRYPVGHFGGQYGGRLAAATWLTASGAPVPADARALVCDFTAASHAGWWWPHTRFVVVSERPSALHLERVGGRAPAHTQRLHRTDGPAAEWPDGYRVHVVHGTVVPADLVEGGWSLGAIHRHPNSEVRRAAIELIGWAEYIQRAGWRLVATAPDPGNPPHELALYEDPRRRLRDVRVLVMTNGSPDRAGALRRHAETVPDTIDDPVAAAAWQYGCTVEVYRQLRRRT